MPPTSTRPRSACARTPRPTIGSATCRPGRTTWSAAGRRRRPARASASRPDGVHPHRVGADERAAAGGLGVPDHARAADDLAALGDGGHDQGRHRRTARARLGQPLHARQGRRRRGDPRLAPVRLRHRSDDPRHARRTGEGAPHDRARAGRGGHHDPLPVRCAEDPTGEGAHGGHRAGLRAGAPGEPPEPRRPARRRTRGASRGPRP